MNPDGYWVTGDLIHKALTVQSMIVDYGIAEYGCYPIEVDSNTLGQYTGEKDCMGHKAFTGDKIKYFIDGEEIEGVIIDCGWCFSVEDFYNPCYDYPTMAFSEDLNFTIIGTIHDKN
jgi:hypothetical protein